jgi:8-oxo-dGTP pyrophosphatase MutT (NUDIX family)
MWLFTTFGFFSVVLKPDDSQLTIRSRTRGDLQRLRQHYLPQATPPRAHGGTDYPWRMRCNHAELAEAMSRIVADIGYGNFKDEVAMVTGQTRARRYGDVWQALYGMHDDLPEPPPCGWEGLPWPQKSPVGKPRAYGGVVIDPQGRLLLREVAGHYGGYVWSYAKGRPDGDEPPRETALREVREELGVDARILLPLAGTFAGTTTRSHFFLMTVDPRTVDLRWTSRETSRLRWALPDEARALLSLTTDATARGRDLAVLEAALGSLPGPLPLKRPIARREDWVGGLLPARRSRLAFERTVTPQEMARIARGFIPTVQEQKWFAYFEDGTLHLHRSWTGLAIYRLHFAPVPKKPGHWRVTKAEVNRHPRQYTQQRDDEDVAILRDLVDGMLIGYGEEPAVDGFTLAALAADRQVYLGSPKVVQALLEPYILALAMRSRGMGSEEAVQLAATRIVGAMTDEPGWARMPWHSQAQLGASLVALMELDADDCARNGLARTVSLALGAVRVTAREIREALDPGEDTGPDSEATRNLEQLWAFVLAAFLGTAGIVFPGMRLRDLMPRRG